METAPVDHDPFAEAERVQSASPWPAPKAPSTNPLSLDYWGEKAEQAAQNFHIPDNPEGDAWKHDPSKGFWENQLSRYEHAAKGLTQAFAGAGEEGLRVHPVTAVPMAAYDTYEGIKQFAETPESARPVPEEKPSAYESFVDAFGNPLFLTGIFAGPEARTANLEKLRLARALENSGANADEIWQKTGWYRSVDPQQSWKFEIPDEAARLAGVEPVIPDVQYRFSGLEHPELAKAYDLDAVVRGEYGAFNPQQRGSFLPSQGARPQKLQPDIYEQQPFYAPAEIKAEGPTAKAATSSSIHEHQHYVANEGRSASGTNPSYEAKRFIEDPQNPVYESILAEPEIARVHRKFLRADRKIGPDFENASPVEQAKWWKLRDELADRVGWEVYHRSAGEVEARAAQARLEWSPSERAATPPWKSWDVPREKQIIHEMETAKAAHEPSGPYVPTAADLPYQITWGEAAGLAGHDVVKSGKWLPKIEEMAKAGTPKEQQQARMRVNFMAQKARMLQREWQYSSHDEHLAAIDDLVGSTAKLKESFDSGVWKDFRTAAEQTKAALDRFADYTTKHYEMLEARRNAPGHARGGAVRKPEGHPHARYISGKWQIPDRRNPGLLVTAA